MRNPFKPNLTPTNPYIGRDSKSFDPFIAAAPRQSAFRKAMDNAVAKETDPKQRELKEIARDLVVGKAGAAPKPLKERVNDYAANRIRIEIKYERNPDRVRDLLQRRERFHPTHPRAKAPSGKTSDRKSESPLNRIRERFKPKDRNREL